MKFKHFGNIPVLKSSQIDLQKTLLLISKHWDPSLKIQPLQDEITKLVLDVKHNLQDSSDTSSITHALRMAIHKNAGYRYTEQVDSRGYPTNNEELFFARDVENQKRILHELVIALSDYRSKIRYTSFWSSFT